VRAEAEFGLEGITLVSVEPPKAPEAPDPNIITPLERSSPPSLTTELAGGRRGPRERANGLGPPQSRPSPRLARPEGSSRRRGGAPGDAGARRERPQGAAKPGGRPLRAPQSQARPAGQASPSSDGRDLEASAAAPGERATSPARSGEGRSTRSRSSRSKEAPRGTAPAAQGPTSAAEERSQSGTGERSRHRRRLSPANVHRNALLESLPPEQRPIAQQLMRGGIPAVRTALYFERERAREEGRPEPSSEGVLAIAESLVGRVKAAEWRDRAEAALRAGDDLLTRDLRSLVTSSDVARDEPSRELAAALREMLEHRVEAARDAWAAELRHLLDDGRVAQALRLSARPPDPAARLTAELAVRLQEAAGEALSSSLAPKRWLELLVAASESPVRRAVKPKGLPANPSPELLEAARQQCGRVPGLAPLLGIAVPPPPGPLVRPKVLLRAPSQRRSHRPRHTGQPQAPRSETAVELTSAQPGQPQQDSPTAGQPQQDSPTAGQPQQDSPTAGQQLLAPDAETGLEPGQSPVQDERPTGGAAGGPPALSPAGGASQAGAL
jgi:hypothetical protein